MILEGNLGYATQTDVSLENSLIKLKETKVTL